MCDHGMLIRDHGMMMCDHGMHLSEETIDIRLDGVALPITPDVSSIIVRYPAGELSPRGGIIYGLSGTSSQSSNMLG